MKLLLILKKLHKKFYLDKLLKNSKRGGRPQRNVKFHEYETFNNWYKLFYIIFPKIIIYIAQIIQ